MKALKQLAAAGVVAFGLAGASEVQAQGCNGVACPPTPTEPTPAPTQQQQQQQQQQQSQIATGGQGGQGGAGGNAVASGGNAVANNGGIYNKNERPIPMGNVGAMSSAACSNSLNISAPFVGIGGSAPSDWCWNLLEGGANLRAGVALKNKELAGIGASQIRGSTIGNEAVGRVIKNMQDVNVQRFNRQHNTFIGLAAKEGEITGVAPAFKTSAEHRYEAKPVRRARPTVTVKAKPACDCK